MTTLMDHGIICVMRFLALTLLMVSFLHVHAQSVWEIPQKSGDIQMDGFLDEWDGSLPKLVLTPSASSLRTTGEFGPNDLNVSLRFVWDRQNLYIAVEWEDDTWDIKRIRRDQAVWVSPDRRRRDRMHFFDNLKVHIQEADYDYILWTSPRALEQGPFMWHRLLEGLTGMETATSPPLTTARFRDNKVSMEILFIWKELRIEPKPATTIPLTLIVADSDLPDGFLESKLDHLKWLEWRGHLRLSRGR